MGANKESIILYYKALICPGGAERLFVKEFEYLSSMGYKVFVVVNRLEEEAMFGVKIPSSSLFIIGDGPFSILKLAKLVHSLGNPLVLCSSGHLDVYLASLIGDFEYALHIHHPCFMSFNDYDKYGFFMRHHFEEYSRSNFGASHFIKIKKQLSVKDLVSLNVKALLSISAKRKSKRNFVLSRYAQKEKKDLYGIESEVMCGALEDSFQVNNKDIRKSDDFVILTVARLDINKRIDELIRAIAILVKDNQNVRLRIVGRGPEKESLQKLAMDLGIADRVEFLGFVPDEHLISLYLSSDLFASIDWADYKITLFESLAKGLPTLVSNETECDDRLLRLGYVRLVKPIAAMVASAITQFMNAPIKIYTEQIREILSEYTWGSYFRKIAFSLSRDDLLMKPNELSSNRREANAYGGI